MDVMGLTEARMSPSDGSENGVAPLSDPLTLLVEGWRFIPHSYSIVNQHQCLELLKRPNVRLLHRDVPLLARFGEPVMGIMDREDEQRLATIPPPSATDRIDAVYRIGYPHDFGPSLCDRTFVFVTCERGWMKDVDILAPPSTDGRMARPFQWRIRDNNITIITPSEWSKRGLVRSGIEEDRIVVIPHGVDARAFYPLQADERSRQRKERNMDGTFTFLHVSAMTGNKNIEGILGAFVSVVKRHPQARLVMKGMSHIFHSNMWLSQELGRLSAADRLLLNKTMYYIGLPLNTESHAQLYQLADAYVAPYQSEGFCIPVLEAAACGLPVIATHGGPTDEFTTPDFCLPVPSKLGDHQHDGTIWFETQQKDIEDQMERVIADHEWRCAAAMCGPSHVRRNYSWKKVVDGILSTLGAAVQC